MPIVQRVGEPLSATIYSLLGFEKIKVEHYEPKVVCPYVS